LEELCAQHGWNYDALNGLDSKSLSSTAAAYYNPADINNSIAWVNYDDDASGTAAGKSGGFLEPLSSALAYHLLYKGGTYIPFAPFIAISALGQ
jgi:hypothetical protein